MTRPTILVRCPLVSCNKLTGWQYPSFAWAMEHCPGLPGRSFVTSSKHPNWRADYQIPERMCPDPFGHINRFKTSRGEPELVPESTLRSSATDDETSDGSNAR